MPESLRSFEIYHEWVKLNAIPCKNCIKTGYKKEPPKNGIGIAKLVEWSDDGSQWIYECSCGWKKEIRP